jgi:hypothetical protein
VFEIIQLRTQWLGNTAVVPRHNRARASRVLFAALMAALLMTGASRGENPAPKASLVHDQVGYVRQRFGEPLPIEKDGEVVRNIFLYKGRAAADTEDPNRVFFYHALAPVVVKNSHPLPGMPEAVHRVSRRGRNTALEFHFRLSSPELRQACAHWLRASQKAFFEKQERPSLQVVVEREPALELFVAVTDAVSEVTLAHGRKYIKSEGDVVSLFMEFEPDTLGQFLELYGRGEVEFTFASLVNARVMVLGHQRTQVDYELGLKVERELASGNFPKPSLLPGKDGQYILQGGRDYLLRSVSADIRKQIAADEASVLTLFQSDTLLVAEVFDPARTLKAAEFQQAFGPFDEQALSAYLEPLVRTVFKNAAQANQSGTGKTFEVTKSSGGGFGISLPFLGGNTSRETRERTLDTFFNVTGLKLEEGETGTEFKLAEIRVHKLKSGYEKKQLSQAQTVVVGKGSLDAYLKDTPVKQTLNDEVLRNSANATVAKVNLIDELLGRKKKLETEAAELTGTLVDGNTYLNATIKAQAKCLGDLETYEKRVLDAAMRFAKYERGIEFFESQFRAWNHAKLCWGLPNADHHIGVHARAEAQRLEDNRNESARAKSDLDAYHAEIVKLVSKRPEAMDVTVKSLERLQEIRRQVAAIDAEIMAIQRP